jgi:hypothetical protein
MLKRSNPKNFFKDHEEKAVIKEWDVSHSDKVTKEWTKEVPEYVQTYNSYKEDRNAVIYLTLFVENHLNKTLLIIFPDFDDSLGISETHFSTKINILQSFRLFPKQIFEALKCVRDIRNEFAHEISIKNFEDLNTLNLKRKNKTTVKLIKLTTEYEGDYKYEKIEDNLNNRFKSLCLNIITALRIFEPRVEELRKNVIEKFN